MVPKHIAFVMDGNGRWAIQKNLSRSAGHRAGTEALFNILEVAQEMGIKWITVFGFSTENWTRPDREIKSLFDFNYRIILERKAELIERKVRVYFAGDKDERIPKRLAKEMHKLEEETKDNTAANLVVAFNYGGRSEILSALQSMIRSGIKPEEVSEQKLREYLYLPEAPFPDLVIRTSGEIRISNFLIWQIAYSELVFLDVLWPDFTVEHLNEALEIYESRERRYGGVNENE